MYKIMTKLHTQTENVYRYYMIRNGQGKLVDFETEDREEAAEVAIELLRRIGYLDLRVVDEQPYYIDVEKTDDPGVLDEDIENAEKLLGIVGYDDLYLNHDVKYDVIWNWGVRPEPIEETYTLIFVNDLQGSWDYPEALEIKAGESRTNHLTIEGEYESFHLIVDGYDCRQGMPEWIEYLGDLTFRFNNIQADHEIEVVVDVQPGPIPPEPGELVIIEEGGTYNIEYKYDAVLPENIMEIIRTVDRVDQFYRDEKTGQDLVTRLGICWIDKPLIGYMKEWTNSSDLHHAYYTMVNREILDYLNLDTKEPLEYTHDGWVYADYVTDQQSMETRLVELRYLDSIEPLTIRADMVKKPTGEIYDLNDFDWLISNSQRIDN